MTFKLRHASSDDLSQIMVIEQSGFSPEEAASEAAMQERIQHIADTFIVATDDRDHLLGYVVGPVIDERHLYDELFEQTIENPATGGYQTILSLVVAPKAQKLGVAGALLNELKQRSVDHRREGITLTCLEKLIPYYEKHGYAVDGVSDSAHAGEVWYDMVLDLK